MTTASKILTLARAELGVCESPSGSNNVKYNTWYYGRTVSGSSYSWCMVFVQYLFNEAGMPLPKTASCTYFMNFAKSTGRWVTSGYQPGDIILYNFDKVADADHVGICESAAGSTVTCIEGNTGTTSQDNGGKVMRRTRSTSLVLGAYRPAYTADVATQPIKTTAGGTCNVTISVLKSGSKGSSVRALQILLNGNGCICGTADGDFGAKTLTAVKVYQKAKGLSVDGIVGQNTWKALLQ